MKSLVTVILFSMFLVSCSHFHSVNATDKKNIIEVQLSDISHNPKIGQRVKVYNWNTAPYYTKTFKSKEPKGWVNENWVPGKIIEIISSELIRVELEDDLKVKENTLVEF